MGRAFAAGVLLFAAAVGVALIGRSATTDALGLVLAVAATVVVLGGWIAEAVSAARRRSRLRRAGLVGAARIVSASDAGGSDPPSADLVLEVRLPDRAPYRVRLTTEVPQLMVGRLTDGRPLRVLVDPERRQDLLIDWTLPQPAPPS